MVDIAAALASTDVPVMLKEVAVGGLCLGMGFDSGYGQSCPAFVTGRFCLVGCVTGALGPPSAATAMPIAGTTTSLVE